MKCVFKLDSQSTTMEQPFHLEEEFYYFESCFYLIVSVFDQWEWSNWSLELFYYSPGNGLKSFILLLWNVYPFQIEGEKYNHCNSNLYK